MEAAGFALCEAEVRNMYDFNPDGSIGAYRTPDRLRKEIDAGAKKRDYSKIRIPVLSIFATPTPPGELSQYRNAEHRAAVETEYGIPMKFIGRYEKSLRSAVPDARVLEWPGANHYLFMVQEADALREVLAFVKGLR